jgi:hypothetical protein
MGWGHGSIERAHTGFSPGFGGFDAPTGDFMYSIALSDLYSAGGSDILVEAARPDCRDGAPLH